MPRRSAGSFAVAPQKAQERPPLVAPADLSPAARAVWRRTVAAVGADHFRASDVPLLRTFCEASALADRAAAELVASGAVVDGKCSAWLVVAEKASRTQATLALRLRLCPSARTDPKTVGRNPGPDVFQPDFSRLERK